MAGVDDNHGTQIRCCGNLRLVRSFNLCRYRNLPGVGDGGPQLGPAIGGKRLNEGRAIHFLQLEHQPRRLTVGRIQHLGAGDPGRTGQIKHDPRAARHHQAVPERLYQPTPGGADARWKPKADLGDIDDHPIRIGKRKGLK